MNYREIQNEVIRKYRVTINENSKCWDRMHVHPRKRMICKWHPKNSSVATFELLHEIGHLENNTSSMRRAEQEYYATVWALEQCEKYGVRISEKLWLRYQAYIDMEKDRGIRRGGKRYGELQLPVKAIK